jgi:serine/threonine-protein kinase RsbW/stage II sporulation protein AB (anti-sigma F factor)
MPEERRQDVVLAVNEACTNAVMHAYPDGDGELAVRARESSGLVVIDVCDEGSGISPRVDSPGLGVGLPMIVMLADSVRIDQPAQGGTRVRMRFKSRPAAR